MTTNFSIGILAVAAAILLSMGVADAAGPFDGNSQGAGSGDGGVACHDQNFTLSVANGAVTGMLMRERTSNQIPIQGTVAADGAFVGEIVVVGGRLPRQGKFAGNSFTGGYKFRDSTYHITMQKAS